MNASESRRPGAVILRHLLGSGPGRLGVALFLLLVTVALVVVAVYPADFGRARWANPALWADNPKAAPPAWTDLFSRAERAPHQERHAEPAGTEPAGQPGGDGEVQHYRVVFTHQADEAPAFLTVTVDDVTVQDPAPGLAVVLGRPDGEDVVLYQGPLRRSPARFVLTNEPQAVDGATALLGRAYGMSVPRERVADNLEAVLFGHPDADGRLLPLPGEYQVEVRLTTYHADDGVARVRAVLGGTVFGLMGTDAVGRDLAEGLLFGLPVALTIGLAASLLSTVIGAGLGLVSGYTGGWTDTAIQRLSDIVVNIPVLPLLIFMVFVFRAQLWLIMLVLVAFGWPGLTIMVRSMVLQLRSSPEVESAVTLGASRARILARHVFPHIAPFVFAQLIFFAPAAILACQAGKDVYLEKPASHNPHEGELLIKAANKYNRVMQMGNQRRSWPNVIAAIKELHQGIIGRPYYAKTWYTNNRGPIGNGKKTTVPDWLDFDLWQGPAPREDFRDNLIHYNWHWFWNWGTGEALNNGTHMIDLARWGLGVDYPIRVSSAGGRYRYTDDWETPDTQTINLEFDNNTKISWEGRSCNGLNIEGSSVGVMFYGEDGALKIDGGNSYTVYDLKNKVVKEVKNDTSIDARNITNPAQQLDALHIQNLFSAIRQGITLHSDIESGHISTLLCQLGNIALLTGETLQTDPKNGRIKNSKSAARHWKREYQKGWEPKV
jgi:ABC-type dipeptide/oligopeptide/nickel transport system permease subunit/predicted dehydrogenase